MSAAEPKRSPHRPMRRRIVFVDDQAAPRDLQGTGRVVFAITPMLERALPMGERQAGVGARECWVEPHSHLEEMARGLVLCLGEAVHVPKAAVIGLPSVKRVGRP